jgi:hypothetical protein
LIMGALHVTTQNRPIRHAGDTVSGDSRAQ